MPIGIDAVRKVVSNSFAQFGLEFLKQQVLESVGLGGVTGANKPKKWVVWAIVNVELRAFVPPFKMLINPENIRFGMKQNVTEIDTRGGRVFYHWGSEHDNVTGSGTTAMFYNRKGNKQGGITNLNVRNRNEGLFDAASQGLHRSEGYEDFIKLVRIYRANGVRWDVGPGLDRQSEALGLVEQSTQGGVKTELFNQISETVRENNPFAARAYEDYFHTNVAPGQLYPADIGKVLMYYDGELFWGFFTNFGFEESGEKPFNFTYDFTFHVLQKLGEYRVISNASAGVGPALGFFFLDTLPEQILTDVAGAVGL